MSFQAYLDNIRAKTGKTPEQFKALASKAGIYSRDMKAGARSRSLYTTLRLLWGRAQPS